MSSSPVEQGDSDKAADVVSRFPTEVTDIPPTAPVQLDPMTETELSNRGLFGRLWDGFVSIIPTGLLRFWPIRISIMVVSLVRTNRVMALGAEIAYWMVLSVVPLLLAIASTLGWLSKIVGQTVADEARDQLAKQVTILFGTEGTAATSIDRLFGSTARGALTLSLITSFLAASRGFISLVGALGLISGHATQRNWIMTRVIGLLVMLLSLVVLVTLLVVTGVAKTGLGLASPWDGVVSTLILPISMVVMTGWAAVLLHVAPREHTPIAFDLPGAVLTALWWVAGSYLTGWYIETTSSSEDVLGLLGSGVGILIWLYVIAVGILIGAQFNAAIRIDRRRPGLVMRSSRKGLPLRTAIAQEQANMREISD